MRARLYTLDREVGSTKCGKKKCEVCVIVSETNTSTSNVTGDTIILSCKCCRKKYAGKQLTALGTE